MLLKALCANFQKSSNIREKLACSLMWLSNLRCLFYRDLHSLFWNCVQIRISCHTALSEGISQAQNSQDGYRWQSHLYTSSPCVRWEMAGFSRNFPKLGKSTVAPFLIPRWMFCWIYQIHFILTILSMRKGYCIIYDTLMVYTLMSKSFNYSGNPWKLFKLTI